MSISLAHWLVQQLTDVTLLTIDWILRSFFFACLVMVIFLMVFIPESLAIPYLELIVVGILLPRMIFHFSAKKCLNNPRKSSTRLYIGICCFFSRIFGVFCRFSCGFGQIFNRFLNRSLLSPYSRNLNSLLSPYRIDFHCFRLIFGFHWIDRSLISLISLIDFIFWISYGSLWSFFPVSFFGFGFWLFIFLDIEIPVRSNGAMSPRNFSRKMWKKSKKHEKTRKKGVQKKGRFLTLLYQVPFLAKNTKNTLLIAPLAGLFLFFSSDHGRVFILSLFLS